MLYAIASQSSVEFVQWEGPGTYVPTGMVLNAVVWGRDDSPEPGIVTWQIRTRPELEHLVYERGTTGC